MNNLKKPIIFDTDQAWQKLHSRIQGNGITAADASLNVSRQIRPFLKFAAGFLLLVVSAGILYLGVFRAENTTFTSWANTEQQTLVKTLSDGSVVYLAQHSEITLLPGFSPDERRVFLKGEAFFDVAHNPAQPFIVEASDATIQVVGTAFNVRSIEPRHVELFVEQGLVNVSARRIAAAPVLVQPGELIKLSGSQMIKSKPTELSLTLWRQNRMHFKDESLENIIAVINKNYGSKLVLDNQQVGQRKMTVTFYNNSVQGIVDLISLSMNLNAISQPDNSILLTAK